MIAAAQVISSREKQRRRVRIRRWLKRSALALTAFSLVSVMSWLWIHQWPQQQWQQLHTSFVKLSIEQGLIVNHIWVTGRHYTDRDTLTAMANVSLGEPMVMLSPVEIKQRIKQLPWVGDVRVERRWPDQLWLHLKERQPTALWQNQNRIDLIDAAGEKIEGQDIQQFTTLPLVVGDQAATEAVKMLHHLSQVPALYRHVRALVWVGQRRWDVHLVGGTRVLLPAAAPLLAWQNLAKWQAEYALLEQNLAKIDLRLPHRLSMTPHTAGSTPVSQKKRGPEA